MSNRITRKTLAPQELLVAASDAESQIKARADYVCDGTSDNVQIQAAIDRVESSKGKVRLSEGTFAISATVEIGADITFQGSGWGTILQAVNSLNDYVITFTPGASGITVKVKDLKVDGNNANQTSGGCIDADGAIQCLFSNLHLTQAYERALFIHGDGAAGTGHHNRVVNCLIDEGDNGAGEGSGVYMQASDENFISNCDFENNKTDHIIDRSGLQKIINNVFVGGAANGVNVNFANHTSIIGNTFDGVQNHNVLIDGSNCVINDNLFYNPQNGAADNTYSVLYMKTGGNGVVSGNYMATSLTASKTRSVVRDNSTGENYYTGNQFKTEGAVGTALVEDTSSNSKFVNNRGKDDSVSAASATTAGKVELATAAETTTGTDATRAVTPDGLAGSEFGERAVQIMVFEPTTDTATGDGKAYFHVDSRLAGMNLVDVHAEVITAGTTGTTDIQIRNVTQAADMLSTKLTIDSAETGSDTAATAAVIDTANDDVAENDLIAIDVDAVSTTAAKGLIVTMGFRLP